jgi:hypothetical protein
VAPEGCRSGAFLLNRVFVCNGLSNAQPIALLIVQGITWNGTLLVSAPPGVVTVT